MVFLQATTLKSYDKQTAFKRKWIDFVDGENGCFYGIPYNASRVLQFNVEERSIKEIGPFLGDQHGKYWKAMKADNGSIYCLPGNTEYILKIVPEKIQDAKVTILEDKQLPNCISTIDINV